MKYYTPKCFSLPPPNLCSFPIKEIVFSNTGLKRHFIPFTFQHPSSVTVGEKKNHTPQKGLEALTQDQQSVVGTRVTPKKNLIQSLLLTPVLCSRSQILHFNVLSAALSNIYNELQLEKASYYLETCKKKNSHAIAQYRICSFLKGWWASFNSG